MSDRDREAYEFYADPANRKLEGTPRKRKIPRKTAFLSVRFDPAILERVSRLASVQGVGMSGWIRAAVSREEYRQRARWLDEHRGELEVVPGSGRLGEPRTIPSSLSPGRTFRCPHMSVGNVLWASCGTCGPIAARENTP